MQERKLSHQSQQRTPSPGLRLAELARLPFQQEDKQKQGADSERSLGRGMEPADRDG